MAVVWTSIERSNIYTCLVQKYGVAKPAAWSRVLAMEADPVNMLLLPNPASWDEVWQCADACMRKSLGQAPIVRTLTDILGVLL